jgi:hypothetical protein
MKPVATYGGNAYTEDSVKNWVHEYDGDLHKHAAF